MQYSFYTVQPYPLPRLPNLLPFGFLIQIYTAMITNKLELLSLKTFFLFYLFQFVIYHVLLMVPLFQLSGTITQRMSFRLWRQLWPLL
jgi:hypothetical protein